MHLASPNNWGCKQCYHRMAGTIAGSHCEK